MAKSIDPQFYKSRKWQRERELYRREHPFCERCLESGVYKPTDIVHHKKYLKADNYLDSKVSLNSDNLEALCFDCHNKEHHSGKIRRKGRRWAFVNGELVMTETENGSPIDVSAT